MHYHNGELRDIKSKLSKPGPLSPIEELKENIHIKMMILKEEYEANQNNKGGQKDQNDGIMNPIPLQSKPQSTRGQPRGSKNGQNRDISPENTGDFQVHHLDYRAVDGQCHKVMRGCKKYTWKGKSIGRKIITCNYRRKPYTSNNFNQHVRTHLKNATVKEYRR